MYRELKNNNYDIEIVNGLKNKNKEFKSMSLEAVLDESGISSTDFKFKFKSNPQEREDLEAYIVLIAVLFVKKIKPDPWVEKYQDIMSFKNAYPDFDDNNDENGIEKLMLFANVMCNCLRYMRGRGNQQRLLTLVACIVEGPDHSRYITGVGLNVFCFF